VCRNTLMYFNAETQSRILVRLNFALNDGGFLFLGKSEMMLTRSNLFSPQSLKHRIFSKVNDSNMRDRLLEMAQVSDVEAGNHLARQIRLRDAAMDSAPVAQMVLNMNSELVLINARARLMFNLSPKDLGRPLQDLEISYRPVELRSLIDQANGERRSVSLTQVQRSMPNGEIQYLDVQVVPMRHNDDALLGVTVTFTDVSDSRRLQDELRHTAHDLETAYEELQSANEELETTNEELQSANEELETTNEELQSANEELETMNEELQSSNEELRTVNDELRHRTEEFNRINSWLQSLLSVPPSGLVVMDHELRILLWNQRAEDMWGLRSDEVQGKSFFELDIGLPIHQLREPIRACFEGRQSETTLVLDAVNRRGRAIKCEVIVKMFGELGDESMGVAISMEDVTARERSIQERDEKERQFKLLLESLPFIVLAQGENNNPVFWSREAQRLTGWGVDDIVGNPRYLELLYPDDRYRAELQVELSALGDGSRSWAGKVTAKDGSSKTISWTSLSKQISVPGWKDWLIGKEVE
jgi:two-component system, chemotaxis family, CheB/CheR fusion protein